MPEMQCPTFAQAGMQPAGSSHASHPCRRGELPGPAEIAVLVKMRNSHVVHQPEMLTTFHHVHLFCFAVKAHFSRASVAHLPPSPNQNDAIFIPMEEEGAHA